MINSDKKSLKELNFDSQLIYAGQPKDPVTGAVIPPISLSTTFAKDTLEETQVFDYSRAGNPTRSMLETAIMHLERGKAGFAFASGCAAIHQVFSLLKPGDHIISETDLYGGTKRLFDQVLSKSGLEFTYVDTQNPEEIKKAIQKNTKMIWLETPTNPLLKVVDIAMVSEIAKKNNLLLGVDNTFATPYLQKPIEQGADLVIHSGTKYLGGHSDVVMGMAVVNKEELIEPLEFLIKSVGAVPSAFDCYLMLRSLKTLSVRMERHCANAQKVCDFLENHKAVEKVLYPGSKNHKSHELAKKNFTGGFGGVLSFVLKKDEAAANFFPKLKMIYLAESLGGVESLISHPATMTHASLTAEDREARGINHRLIRFSVGIESIDDILKDLSQALDSLL